MGYDLDAFIGPIDVLRTWQRLKPPAVVHPLTDQLGLVPITGPLELALLPDEPAAWARAASKAATLAFVSAGYFGGEGDQTAAVFARGQCIASAVTINRALELLGVSAADGMDEFDTVGLGRYRKTGRWAAAATIDDVLRRREDPEPALLELVVDARTPQMVRERAASALADLGPPQATAFAALADLAETDDNSSVRHSAARALASIGEEGVSALLAILERTVAATRECVFLEAWPVLTALGKAGSNARQAAPPLADHLEHRESNFRRDVAHALGEMGSAAELAVPKLLAALNDEDDLTRAAVAEALGRIGTAKGGTVSALLRALGDESPSVRQKAARSLVAIDDRIEDRVVPALTELVGDPVHDVASEAVECLATLGTRAAPALPILLTAPAARAQDSFHEYFRERVCEALARVAPGDERAAHALIDALRDPKTGVRRSAVAALGRVECAHSKILAALIAFVGREQGPMALRDAVDVLGGMGPGARAALAAIRPLAEHERREVREAAAAAIGRIEGA